ncbi:hypothetical protein AB0J72_18820 [Dactylosporangium sp. NPDC049742]|uniref:hypothetical protein n=1 Tax=Dactylosporangium sp. NPDC049742 TaxID=3154737 RepID=UPI00344AE243
MDLFMSRRYRLVALVVAAAAVLGIGVVLYLRPWNWCVQGDCRAANWTADRTSIAGFTQSDRQYLQGHVEVVLVGPSDRMPSILTYYAGPIDLQSANDRSQGLYEQIAHGVGNVDVAGGSRCGVLLTRFAQGRAPLPSFHLSRDQVTAVTSGQSVVLVLSVGCGYSQLRT